MSVLRQIAQLGHPVLRQETGLIGDASDPALRVLIDDMLATMAEANGVGIAAPQVYEPVRLFIVASRPNPRYPHAPAMEPTAMINPEILWQSDETEKGWEGCLSVPGLRGLVPRSLRIGVRYLSRGDGVCEEELSGFIARVFQHEYDHISGMVFLDRVASNRDLISEREYLRLVSA
jgi:peptide deformylase